MVRNRDFLQFKEERESKCFFKRAIPYDFVRSFSDDELSGSNMEIITKWGRTWEMGISKNPRFYFMEKAGWEKFVKDNFLGDNEFLTFTHRGNMQFTVNIFEKDEREMIQPRQIMDSSSPSSRIKTEQGDENAAAESSHPRRGFPTTAESNGGGNSKRKLRRVEESENTKRTKKVFSRGRDSAGASSSCVGEFTILVQRSYLTYLAIPQSIAMNHMPKHDTTLKIHHQDMNMSWHVGYLARSTSGSLSSGWSRLCKEYPIAVGECCSFTMIKPGELLLVVSKPSP
ncbi:unnamed protein product [Microthlaspi erraticum]|uniref:TF-B3 domain-containing protein n=1 Tax=Microthlaspi erraticum TaxID=1685480 RepID=A0A6D2IET4_9BRAS|nr:unnamed protein product [Microthlaspi erraticum]CAA7051799.1 unnamed protein product [Microthlaspi erraticum]